jgi:hypothetical protein
MLEKRQFFLFDVNEMETFDVLTESEVTSENIASLFKRAFMSCSIDEDGDLKVQVDDLRVILSIHDGQKLLKMMAIFGVNESSPLELKHAFVNKMNDVYILTRFSIPEQRSDVLMADYFMPYEGGISTHQLVSTTRTFARIARSAIRDCDEHDLVE